MPFHTITDFSFSDFIAASLDFLLAHPLALGAVVAAALLVVVELSLRIAHHSAKRRVAQRRTDRVVSIEVAREQLMKAIARGKDGTA